MGFKLKVILLFLFVLSTTDYLFSQSLQFEQVVTFSGDVQVLSTSIADGPIYTCPPGKIWKVESLNIYQMGSNTNNSYMTYKVNSSPLGVDAYASPFTVNAVFPIWLKGGDTIQPSFNPVNQSAFGGYLQSYFISILEFTAP
jgi:hypothetical protein